MTGVAPAKTKKGEANPYPDLPEDRSEWVDDDGNPRLLPDFTAKVSAHRNKEVFRKVANAALEEINVSVNLNMHKYLI